MIQYIIRRLIEGSVLVVFVLVSIFLLVRLTPGDPVYVLAGTSDITPEFYEATRQKFGLDKPIYLSLALYIASVLHGDLGFSYTYDKPVLHLILQRLPYTLQLMIPAIVLASIVGILMGIAASLRPHSVWDNLVTGISVIGYSIPVFWLAQILIVLFAFKFKIFPTGGIISLRMEDLSGVESIFNKVWHLVLPVTTLSTFYMAQIARQMRSNMIDILNSDFIVTARAKGLLERRIIWVHALRNAILPVVTLIGLLFGMVVAGSVVTETVFAIPGLGTLLYGGLANRDYPVITGVIIFLSVFVVLANLLTDIVYTTVDPRIGLY